MEPWKESGRMWKARGQTKTVTYGFLPSSDWLATATFTRTGVSGNTLVQTRTPDGANRLASVVTTRGATTVESHGWSYDSVGRRSADTLAGSEGTRWDYEYNARNEVTSGQRKLVSGNVPLAGYQFGYGYDAIGNRKSTTVNGRYAGYTTNALNQYTARDVPAVVDVLGSAAAEAVVTVTGPEGAVTASKAGTRFAAEVPVPEPEGVTPSPPRYPSISVEAKRVTGTGTPGTVTTSSQSGHLFVAANPEQFSYDLDGNTLSDGRWSYAWDGENRLISAETLPAAVSAGVPRQRLEFAYDAQGRRIHKLIKTGWNGSTYATTTTRRYVYGVGWNLYAELDAGTTVQRRCLWGLDLSGSLQGAGGVGGLLVENIAGTDYLPCYDGNGNLTTLIKASDGSEAARYTYGSFGEPLRATGLAAKVNSFRWSTKYCDEETGHSYYGHRYYSPTVGRWLSRDPIEERGGQNLYEFVYNNPANKIDFLGQSAIDLALKIAGMQIPKATGLSAGGAIVAKVPGLRGLIAGGATSVMFFPDSCEVAGYSVRAGLGNSLAEWRPPTPDDYNKWYEAGLIATLGFGIEVAGYVGNTTPGAANADSFTGLFHTLQVAFTAQGLPIGASAYFGDKDATGGRWIGGTLGVGPGAGLAVVDWNYQFMMGPRTVPKCLCYAAILAMP